jgi:hypothetical protein
LICRSLSVDVAEREAWVELVEAEERQSWIATIDADQKEQQLMLRACEAKRRRLAEAFKLSDHETSALSSRMQGAESRAYAWGHDGNKRQRTGGEEVKKTSTAFDANESLRLRLRMATSSRGASASQMAQQGRTVWLACRRFNITNDAIISVHFSSNLQSAIVLYLALVSPFAWAFVFCRILPASSPFVPCFKRFFCSSSSSFYFHFYFYNLTNMLKTVFMMF